MNEQKQIGQLFGIMMQNMPEMTVEQRQRWIGDPKGLQDFLSRLNDFHFNIVDNTITFILPATDGTTGENWITRLEGKGYRLSNYAKQVLLSKSFKPTTGKVNSVMVLKGDFFSDENRVTEKIREEAKKRNLTNLNAETACLIRENFSDEELKVMGLVWLVVMHEPIKDSDGDLSLLNVDRNGGGRWLNTYYDCPDSRWDRGYGFAFAAAQGTLS
ncbi:MAG: hypothetical protein WC827_04335 [Candidatus Paceibacterota bacterium]|jgi:hypothetical protein